MATPTRPPWGLHTPTSLAAHSWNLPGARARPFRALSSTLLILLMPTSQGMTIIGDGAGNELPARNGYMIQAWLRVRQTRCHSTNRI